MLRVAQNYIKVEKDGAVATVTLDSPPLNILNLSAIQELNKVLQELAADEEVSLVVITGAGKKAFSAGVDVKDHTPERVREALQSFHQVFKTLLSMKKITMAAVTGYALGGGCELASMCDLVIADADAKFGQPEINLGCFPPVASLCLPFLMGPKYAFWFLLSGETISAREAKQHGLVTVVAPKGKMEAALNRLLKSLLSKSPVVLRHAKEAMTIGVETMFVESLKKVEELYFDRLMKTHDAVEGVQAFLEKRKPVWKGR